MDFDVAYSIGGVPIRLTAERWRHIVEHHDDVAGRYDECLATVEAPDLLLRGYGGALIATRGIGLERWLAVIYKEVSPDDGFILTAYTTRRINRNAIVWRSGR
jgi:hypothetical protein